jgi:hypothetical protein
MEGYKTHVIKKKYFPNMVGIPLVLVEGDKALGVIILEEPEEIEGWERFRRTRELHRVSDEEAVRWWGGFDVLYLYPVRRVLRYKEPKSVEVPVGVQTFIRDVVFKESGGYYCPSWFERIGDSEVVEEVRRVIKEVMDYGEWEKYFERLRSVIERDKQLRKEAELYSLMDLYKDYEGEGLVCIDVDGTIFKKAEFPYVGELVEGAREALSELRRRGYKIVIWSGRNSSLANTPLLKSIAMNLVKIALDVNGVEYDAIDYGDAGKIPCEIYIDDRAIGFRGDWRAVLEEVEKLEKRSMR